MRVLLVSKFLHHVGGVETYLRWQAQALADRGHSVAVLGMRPPPGETLMDFPKVPIYLTPERSFAEEASQRQRVTSAAASVYSPAVGRVFRGALEEFRPEVIHFHGTCYQLTSAVFRAARRSPTRIFLTAHEYKLICANQRLFDDRRHELCTDCLGKPALGRSLSIMRRSCIKGSVGPSLLGAIETPIAMRLWRHCGGLVLAPSMFMEEALARDGHAGAVEYLDNPWPPIEVAQSMQRDSVLYMSRLSPEKGIRVALEAWHGISARLPNVRFRVAGGGSEEGWVRDYIRHNRVERVDLLGVLDRNGLTQELARALLSVHPAVWHDNSPLSIRESLCAGVPAAVSNLGGSKELVGDDRGAVLDAHDVVGWGEVMVNAAQSRLAGSSALVRAVRDRWYGGDDHVRALEAFYAGRRPAPHEISAAGRA